jgi:hypothetical protein
MPELEERLEERLAGAYAAGTDAELATIGHDLKAATPQPGAAPTSVRDVGIIAMTPSAPTIRPRTSGPEQLLNLP